MSSSSPTVFALSKIIPRTYARGVWILCFCLAIVSPCTSRAAEKASVKKPNILLFITDDESWLERGAYGWSKVPTPNFDRVAKEGVLFNHAFTSAPSCAPSRASLLTGRNFWELEQGAFIQAWLPKKFPVVTDVLAAAGYHVGHLGKGWGPGVTVEGSYTLDCAGPAFNKIKVKKPEQAMNAVDYPANFTAFLDAGKKGQPFYCWLGTTEPHAPWAADNYLKLKEHYGVDFDQVPVPGFMPDTPAIRRDRANFFYEVCYADEQLGKVMKILEERGELENTLIIATSDNGTSVPVSKATPYDWGVHEPLAVMWPGHIKPGRVVDDFVNFPDFAPTMIEAAGAKIPESMSGQSMLNILLSDKFGQVDPSRTTVVTGLEWHGELPPTDRASRTIRDTRYEYVVNYGHVPATKLDPSKALPDALFEKTAAQAPLSALLQKHPHHPKVEPVLARLTAAYPPEELYDLEQDPWQLHNLIDDPKLAEVRDRLRSELHAYQSKTGDPRVTGDMKIFDETRKFVIDRKRKGYSE